MRLPPPAGAPHRTLRHALPFAYHPTTRPPRSTVPFIRDGDLVLNESNTIVSYLANKYNRDGIYPESPEDLATAWQWLGERHPTPPHSLNHKSALVDRTRVL